MCSHFQARDPRQTEMEATARADGLEALETVSLSDDLTPCREVSILSTFAESVSPQHSQDTGANHGHNTQAVPAPQCGPGLRRRGGGMQTRVWDPLWCNSWIVSDLVCYYINFVSHYPVNFIQQGKLFFCYRMKTQWAS